MDAAGQATTSARSKRVLVAGLALALLAVPLWAVVKVAGVVRDVSTVTERAEESRASAQDALGRLPGVTGVDVSMDRLGTGYEYETGLRLRPGLTLEEVQGFADGLRGAAAQGWTTVVVDGRDCEVTGWSSLEAEVVRWWWATCGAVDDAVAGTPVRCDLGASGLRCAIGGDEIDPDVLAALASVDHTVLQPFLDATPPGRTRPGHDLSVAVGGGSTIYTSLAQLHRSGSGR